MTFGISRYRINARIDPIKGDVAKMALVLALPRFLMARTNSTILKP
jgi:hypothetical protein